MNAVIRPFAIVTGASSGIGRELAVEAASHGYDLLIAADQSLDNAARELRANGAAVETLQVDLSAREGVALLVAAISDRPVDALLANAGHGLGKGFLEQDFAEVEHVINTNITGTLDLVQQIASRMRARGAGKILITGSIAGYLPGTFQAVYNGTKAFIDSFSYALRNELKDSGVTVTCLMPGATDTDFFARADMLDTQVGADEDKADPAEIAKAGFEAMEKGEAGVIAGLTNRIMVALSNIMPSVMMAEQHRKTAEPGSANR